jgi:hypothetical protein
VEGQARVNVIEGVRKVKHDEVEDGRNVCIETEWYLYVPPESQ